MTCCHGLDLGLCTAEHCRHERWKTTVDAQLDMLKRASAADGQHIAAIGERTPSPEEMRALRNRIEWLETALTDVKAFWDMVHADTRKRVTVLESARRPRRKRAKVGR